jgi:hypothetical protein
MIAVLVDQVDTPVHVGGATKRNGGEGETACQPSRDTYQACQGGAGATPNQEARDRNDEGGGGVLPVPEPPPGASTLHGGTPRLPTGSLPARLVPTGARSV